jgi:CubicO group peptidase (beta-lactamase class C family)
MSAWKHALPVVAAGAIAFFLAVGCLAPSVWAEKASVARDAASSDGPWAKVIARVNSGLEQRNVPSVSIAVARGGRIVWERSFGWADREKQIQATPDTVYSLASVTKPMIATGLMVLVGEGKVDLDAPVERYIGPGRLTVYEGRAEDVTVRRLLHHTAGLPQHFNYFYPDEVPGRPRPLEETIRRFGIIIDPPGKEFRYANLGYALIGDVIARVSGRPLPEFMRERVFGPLGMTAAAFDPEPGDLKGLAVRYDKRGAAVPFFRCDTPGAGHGFASARDLIRLGMFHLKDHLADQTPILDDRAIDLMQTEKDGAAHLGASGESYGLGWFMDDTTRGARTVWHEGGWTGASAMLKLVPSENIAVAVLINVFDSEFVNGLADETIGALLAGYGDAQSKAASPAPATVSASAPSPFEIPAGTYSGEIRTFEGPIPLTLEKESGGALYVRLGDPGSPARPVRDLPPLVLRRSGQYMGSFAGPLGDSDSARYPHSVTLALRMAGDGLVGTASAMTLTGLDIVPNGDQRQRFMLPYRVSLKRVFRRGRASASY